MSGADAGRRRRGAATSHIGQAGESTSRLNQETATLRGANCGGWRRTHFPRLEIESMLLENFEEMDKLQLCMAPTQHEAPAETWGRRGSIVV